MSSNFTKPGQPYPDFPLFAHAFGTLGEEIRGRGICTYLHVPVSMKSMDPNRSISSARSSKPVFVKSYVDGHTKKG